MRFLSAKAHTLIGLIVGVVLLFAPQIFGFNAYEAPTSVAIGVAIFIILSELVTTSQISPFKWVPMQIHLVLDYITGAFLAISPWLFGFAGTMPNIWVPHLIVGILVIGYAVVTDPTTAAPEHVAE
jgi:hypothetical protein